MKGEYCLSTSGVGSPPHSLPSTSGTQNDKIEDVHCACISKLETQVEEQVRDATSNLFSFRKVLYEKSIVRMRKIRRVLCSITLPVTLQEFPTYR